MFKFYNFKTISSTNHKAKEFSKKGLSNIVIIADKQTRGKGRFNRKWDSGIGGLYMTIVLKVSDLDKVRYLTLIASISVVKAIKEISKLNAEVKWPNDVLTDNKKICGILTETLSGKENYALVGIGLNVNQNKFDKGLTATSLKIESNKNYNIEKISKIVITNFNLLYKYYNKKDYKKIIDVWKKCSHTLGKKVKVKTLSGDYIGDAIDIDNNCNLMLRLKDGNVRTIVEGDVFVV